MSTPIVTDEFPLILPFQFLTIPLVPSDLGRLILSATDPCAVLSLLGITLGVDGGTPVGFDDLQAVDGGAPSGFDDLIFDGGIPGTVGAFPFNFPFGFPTEIPGLTVADGGSPGSSGPAVTIGTTTVDGGSPQC